MQDLCFTFKTPIMVQFSLTKQCRTVNIRLLVASSPVDGGDAPVLCFYQEEGEAGVFVSSFSVLVVSSFQKRAVMSVFS